MSYAALESYFGGLRPATPSEHFLTSRASFETDTNEICSDVRSPPLANPNSDVQWASDVMGCSAFIPQGLEGSKGALEVTRAYLVYIQCGLSGNWDRVDWWLWKW